MGDCSVPSLVGILFARALSYLRRLDWVPFRGVIRGCALDKTSGRLLSDFDPFDSLGHRTGVSWLNSLCSANSGSSKGRHTSRAGMATIYPQARPLVERALG